MKPRTALLLVAVASFISLPQSHAAFITHTSAGTFTPAVSSLNTVGSTGFESDSVGGKGVSFSSGGIGFAGSIANSVVTLPLAVHADVGTGRTLGTDGGFTDFTAGPQPDGGDILTISVPAGSRALRLSILAAPPPDITNFARLTLGTTSVDLFQGQPGVNVVGSPFSQYFLGISGPLVTDTFSTATVRFFGGGVYRVDDVAVFSAIPEPGSLALVAVAGIVGLVRRRVRRA